MDPSYENESNSDEELIYAPGAVCAMAGAICAMAAAKYYGDYINKAPYKNSYHTPRTFINEIINSDEHCHNLLRMKVNCFKKFVHEFRRRESLYDTIHCRIEEQVAILLHTLAHNQRV